MSKIGHDVIGEKTPHTNIVNIRNIALTQTEQNVKKAKDYLAMAKVVALNKSPFLYSVLSSAEIRLTDKVPVAAVDQHGVLYINPEGMMKVAPTPKQAVSLLLHESLHIALGHFKRLTGPQVNHTVANIAEDAVINNILQEHGYLIDLPIYKEGKLVDMRTISRITRKSISEISDKDAEEIYDMLMKEGQKRPTQKPKPGEKGGGNIEEDAQSYGGWSDEAADTAMGKGKSIEPSDKGKIGEQQAGEGNVLQKGHPDVYKRDPITGEKKYDEKAGLNKAKVDAEMMGKGMGTMPAGFRRMVERLTEAKVDWKSQLRTHVSRGFGALFISTWQIPSRRWGDGDYPGTRMITKPHIYALIDTSGSITQSQLDQFLSELYAISRNYGTPVSAIPFDAQYYETLTAKRPSEIISKIMPKIKGGGGTEIGPALEAVLKERKFRPKDAVIIMSDGDIFDLKDKKVKENMSKLANNASSFIFLSVRKRKEELRPDLPVSAKVLEVRD